MFRNPAIVIAVASLLLLHCSAPKEGEHELEVPADEQVLYTMPGLEHGLIQSPINILTSTLRTAERHEIEVHSMRDDRVTAVVNKGHTIELEFEAGTEVAFDNKTYDFIQAHFHTPSEHQIDGMTFPMEMHFVCKGKTSVTGEAEYLVVAMFFKMGLENEFIDGFINKIPSHENDTTVLSGQPLYIDDLVGPLNPDRKYYYYKGSLTTPPYTETVNWLILREIIDASPDQIRVINDLEGNNARHVQARFGRKVEGN